MGPRPDHLIGLLGDLDIAEEAAREAFGHVTALGASFHAANPSKSARDSTR